jgi:hypothetical protein
MKRLLLTTALLGAVGASPAIAANTALTLWNSTDPGGAETATGTNTAIISGSNLDGITIQTSGASRLTSPANSITESNLFISNTTGTVQTLDIIAGANGFSGPSNKFNASGTILTATGGAQLTGAFFVDLANTALGNGTDTGPVIGTDIANFNSGPITGPFSFSDNGTALFKAPGSYGMAESLQLTLQPGAFIGVQSISMDSTNAVPEPSQWVMLISGFGLLGLLGVSRSRKNRLAAV